MRVHSKMEIVAVNFAELLAIDEACQDILEVLMWCSSSNGKLKLVFRWGGALSPPRGWVQVRIEPSQSSRPNPFQFGSPSGCADDVWASILCQRLNCYLFAGSRFNVWPVMKNGPESTELVLEKR